MRIRARAFQSAGPSFDLKISGCRALETSYVETNFDARRIKLRGVSKHEWWWVRMFVPWMVKASQFFVLSSTVRTKLVAATRPDV